MADINNNQEVYHIQSEDESVDIKRYISLFASNWYWFAAALFISVSLAYGINRYSQEVYSVSATLLIKDNQTGGMNTMATSVIPGGDIFGSQQNLKNEIEILRSFSLNNKVMKALENFNVTYMAVGRRGIVESVQYKNSPFIVIQDTMVNQPKGIKVWITIIDDQKYKVRINSDKDGEEVKEFGENFKKRGFSFRIEKRDSTATVLKKGGSNNYYFLFNNPVDLANEYRSKLYAAPRDKESSLVTLTVSGSVPKMEMDYLNKLMDVYIDNGYTLKREVASKTIAFINGRLDVISDSLEVYAKKLENFRRDNSIIDIKSENTFTQGKFEEAIRNKAELELQLNYYQFLLEYIANKNSSGEIISPSVIGITDMILIGNLNELTNLLRGKNDLKLNIAEKQPAIDLIDEKIQIVRDALQENIKNCIVNLNISKTEAESRILKYENEIRNLPGTEKTFVDIQRQFDLNNTIYTYLLEKRAESGIAEASTQADNRIIDYAQLRGKVRPKTRNNLMIAFVLGLLFPGLAIVLLDFFYNKVIDKRDIEKMTKIPLIGYISHSKNVNEIAVIENPGSSLSESFRSVRTALKYYIREKDVAIIAITSTLSSEGKTFICVNLSAIIAMLGKRVLIIGLDLRKPRMNELIKIENGPGMSNFLSGNCNYEEVIKETSIKNLFYAPSGPVPPNPAELLEKDEMVEFLNRAKKEFDYIIIDTPPVAVVTDTLIISRHADINLFIVRQRYTLSNSLELIDHLHKQGEMKNMAIVMNDISLSGYYGYGLRYGYLNGYGYTYGLAYYGESYYGKYGRYSGKDNYYKE